MAKNSKMGGIRHLLGRLCALRILRSPDRAQRNPGFVMAVFPDFAALYPGYIPGQVR
jgi:hypothetical protein